MLKEYFKTHTIEDLKAFFAKSHLKPFAFNSIEDINFRTPEQWEKLVELFTFGCEVAQAIGNKYMIVVPTMTNEYSTRTEQEVLEDSVEVLNKLADIAEPYGVCCSLSPSATAAGAAIRYGRLWRSCRP